jgi:ABC-type sulfate/molybdate transport systems ATPase subunit
MNVSYAGLFWLTVRSYVHLHPLLPGRFNHIFQILVTHHVELVLPGAHYLVRMLDGRIDTQGTVKDLRAQGVLEDITHDASVEAHKEEFKVQAPIVEEEEEKKAKEAKKPRKLIKDEYRETGGVKWSIYKSYLRASYV